MPAIIHRCVSAKTSSLEFAKRSYLAHYTRVNGSVQKLCILRHWFCVYVRECIRKIQRFCTYKNVCCQKVIFHDTTLHWHDDMYCIHVHGIVLHMHTCTLNTLLENIMECTVASFETLHVILWNIMSRMAQIYGVQCHGSYCSTGKLCERICNTDFSFIILNPNSLSIVTEQ